MAFLEDKIDEIRAPELRNSILQEVKKLKSEKRFGLVFEDHIPELAPIYNAPIRPGDTVAKKTGALTDTYTVTKIENYTVTLTKDSSGSEFQMFLDELVVVKRFGEAIYPALTPADCVETDPTVPYHTIIEADNYHALQLLEYAYAGKVDMIYIDPPYNTGARDWKYNNRYVDNNDSWRHSKWLSMMRKRLLLAVHLLKPDGVLIVTIDDYEAAELGLLLDQIFLDKDRSVVVIKYNPAGTARNGFSRSHEYAYFILNKGQEIEKKPAPLDIRDQNLRRHGNGANRKDSPSMFYPIFINKKTLKVVGAGDVPSDDFHPIAQTIDKGDFFEIWPIDNEDREKRWYYGCERVQTTGAEELSCKWQKDRLHVYFHTDNLAEQKYQSIWIGSEYDAGAHGGVLVRNVLDREFPFPKSVYAVRECLNAIVRNRPDALILDFFAGSGTTLHATLMLNAADDGHRRCILVTNNEVSENEARQLLVQGYQPNNPEWEAQGICRSVTFPRCKYVIQGKRDDDTELEGEYLTGRSISKEKRRTFRKLGFIDTATLTTAARKKEVVSLIEGIPQTDIKAGAAFFVSEKHTASILFDDTQTEAYLEALDEQEHITHFYIITQSNKTFAELKQAINDLLGPLQVPEEEKLPLKNGFTANLEYFKLEFLDPHEVQLGQQFAAILPILWLMAGSKGPRPYSTGNVPYLIPADNPFAVLIDETHFRSFRAAIESRPDLSHIFLVTDSEDAFFDMKTKINAPHIIMLYKSYLQNFKINTQRR